MTEDCVVVIRLENGDDLLAILVGELDGVIKVEHPYIVKMQPLSSSVMMLPYCALTDEVYFEIKRDKIDFVVTANNHITMKFLSMVDAAEQAVVEEMLAEVDPFDDLEADLQDMSYVKGTDTLH